MVYLSPDLGLRFKLTFENYFQATFRKPDMSISWLIMVLSVWVVSAVVLLSPSVQVLLTVSPTKPR